MKCSKCGFIYNGNIDECPYCGSHNKNDDEFLSKRIEINPQISIKISSIINVVIFNLFLIITFVDGFIFKFSSGLTFYGFLVLFGFALVLFLFLQKNRNILAIYFRIDNYLFFSLLVSYITLGKWFIGGNYRPLIASFITPLYLVITSVIMILILLFKKPKIKVLEFGLVLPLRFLIMFVLLVFSLLYLNGIGGPYSNIYYIASESIFSNYEQMNSIFFITTIICFAIISIITINFIIVAFAFTVNKVRYNYGE